VRFWDSSALVPLIVQQTATAEAERWIAEDGAVVAWTLSFVELVSALRRQVREGGASEAIARQAEELAGELLSRAHVVSDVEGVKAIAVRLLRVHALRAADALQLGAAVAWSGGRPEGAILHTFDLRLGEAASREGFRVIPEP
jgi:predicted nucleic acid-binding protein